MNSKIEDYIKEMKLSGATDKEIMEELEKMEVIK